MGLRLPTKPLAEALSSGEYADALDEALPAAGVEAARAVGLCAAYAGQDADDLFHCLRAEYTRLFVGAPHAAASPYAGVYCAEEFGVTPVLYVNRESMEVERFMAACGMGRPEGTNEPLDHIACELEFLEYLSLHAIGAVHDEGCKPVPPGALEEFFSTRFAPFARKLAPKIAQTTDEGLYLAMSQVLLAMVG